jgi:Flp pilus assembly protein protease CpaA
MDSGSLLAVSGITMGALAAWVLVLAAPIIVYFVIAGLKLKKRRTASTSQNPEPNWDHWDEKEDDRPRRVA